MDILHTLTADQQDVLHNFQAITNNEDLDTAVAILEAHGWDLQSSVTSQFEDGANANVDGDDVDDDVQGTAAADTAFVADEPAPPLPANGAPRRVSIWSLLALPVTLPLNVMWILLSYAASFLPAWLRPAIGPGPTRATARADDAHAAAARLLLNFEQTYGASHPEFFAGTYAQALQKAKTEVRYLLAYLHSPEHDDTDAFCRRTLCDADLAPELVSRNVLFWAGDVRNAEAFQAANVLGATAYPFLAIIAPQPGTSRLAVVHRKEGMCTAAEIVAALASVTQRMDPEVATLRAEREAREQTRSIREQQDEAYQASLRADKEKRRKADEAAAAAAAELLLEQQAASRRASVLEAKAARKAALLAALPDEPPATLTSATSPSSSASTPRKPSAAAAAAAQSQTPNSPTQKTPSPSAASPASPPSSPSSPSSASTIANLSIRLPSGNRVLRRFHASDALQRVYEFVETRELDPLDAEADFCLVGMYPRRVYADLDRTLAEEGLVPSASLVVEEKIED
ncbi:FAS-associated factor 2 [Geranomyces variabilis]|uniref:FAS-associated factor 2 n=1 Tax=Geranomyces variabilis TaxID=109894 RepID=A0AAD5TD95_9FUNG|nr:FAS-associated factor 2 [Geranomyces variabilis]